MEDKAFRREASLSRDRYFGDSYFDRKQMDSLVTQLLTVHNKNVRSILEIGPGNGFVSSFLRSAGYCVTTFDINKSLDPDVVGNVIDIRKFFTEKSFDLILCAEVLEHLPFDYIEDILRQLKSISRKWVIISLPNTIRILIDLQVYFKIPYVKPINIALYQSFPNRGVKWDAHSWEVNYRKENSLRSLLEIFGKYFTVENHFCDRRNRTHHFFELLI